MGSPPPSRWQQRANVAASCFTGAAVIALTNPLDCLKNRYQVADAPGVVAFGRRIVRRDGGLVRALWLPGLATNCAACTISVGARLGLYPALRDACPGERRSGVAMLGSGLAGGACGYAVAAPLFHATRVAHVADDGAGGVRALGRLYAAGGAARLWRGAPLLVARGAVMSGTQLATYDLAKGAAVDRGVADGPALHALSSLAASVALTTAMVPLDVTLTHYQAAPGAGGPVAVARSLLARRGPAVFVRGWLPLWARFLPSTVLTFLIYEQARKLLLGTFLR